MKSDLTKFEPVLLIHLANCLIALVATYFAITGPNENALITEASFLPLILICAIILGTSIFCWRFDQKELSFIVFLLTIHFWPRIAQYGIFPQSVYFPANGIGAEDISTALWWFTAFFSTIVFTFVVVSIFLRKQQWSSSFDSSQPLRLKIIVCSIIFLMAVLVEFHFLVNLDNSPYQILEQTPENKFYITKLLNTLLGADSVLILLIFFSIGLISTSFNLKTVLLVSALVFVVIGPFSVLSAFYGSRGVSIKIITMLVALIIIFRSDWKVFWTSTIIGGFCFIIGILFFNSATAMRDFWMLEKPLEYAGQKSEGVYLDQFIENFNVFTQPTLAETDGEASVRNIYLILDIFGRLGSVDYIVVTLSRPADDSCMAEQVNISRQAKSVVNWIMIGTPFPEAKFQSPNFFSNCFRPEYAAQVRLNNEIWTTPGILFQFLGAYGLAGIALLSLLVIFCQFLLINKFGYPGFILYLFMMPNLSGSLIFMLGLDHQIITLATITLRIGFILFVIYLIELTYKHAKPAAIGLSKLVRKV